MGRFIDEHRHLYKASSDSPKEVKITVTENRAVTDKSIELLNEFTQKAQNNIIKAIEIDNNVLKCIAIFYQDEVITERAHLTIKFKLNSREYIVREIIERRKFLSYDEEKREFSMLNKQETIEFIWRKISRKIAQELINENKEVFKGLMKY